jgi:uncharacterized phiE125 gp8 family phage protein
MASLAQEAAPLALQEVKALLRIADGREDALIAGFVRSAAAACEAFTGQALIARPLREVVAANGRWVRLAAGPVRTIDGVAALAPGGAESALAPEHVGIDIDAGGAGWVRVTGAAGASRAAVRFTAGVAADWNGVPEPLRQGIVRLATHLYAARGDQEGSPPASVAALWRPWRRVRLA